MQVSRRGFLGALLATPVAAAVPELWLPTKTIFLPPRGGWLASDALIVRMDVLYGSSPLLTAEMIQRESLRILHQSVGRVEAWDTYYYEKADRATVAQ